jgi:uncharacterized protein (DUF58 family)
MTGDGGKGPAAWTAAPSLVLGEVGAVALAATGLLLSRPDVVAVGLPLALWCAIVLAGRRGAAKAGPPELDLIAQGEKEGLGVVGVRIRAGDGGEAVHLAVRQGGTRRAHALTVPGGVVSSLSRMLHSGPVELVSVETRAVAGDGALLGPPTAPARLRHAVAPVERPLPELPEPLHLRGLHGAHESRRPGQGGDFHDIHPFQPGDELRRIDWKATARLARRPHELHVRRSDALSEAAVTIVMDVSDDLGEAVSTWGSGDPERSGQTSLDRAREAARAVATAAIATGDRVAFHELGGARVVRGGAGSRHLSRLIATIAATGPREAARSGRRTPPIAQGSEIVVLSTFLGAAAAEHARSWRAAGHRVIAIDTLPAPDTAGLDADQLLAARLILAGRREALADLAGSGVDLVAWTGDPLRAARALRMLPSGTAAGRRPR